MGSIKKVYLVLVAMMLGIFAMPSFAIIDITAATTGITDAQTAIASLIGALLALSVSIFGIVKVYNFVSKKAGA